jgi:hypothetical protein
MRVNLGGAPPWRSLFMIPDTFEAWHKGPLMIDTRI